MVFFILDGAETSLNPTVPLTETGYYTSSPLRRGPSNKERRTFDWWYIFQVHRTLVTGHSFRFEGHISLFTIVISFPVVDNFPFGRIIRSGRFDGRLTSGDGVGLLLYTLSVDGEV